MCTMFTYKHMHMECYVGVIRRQFIWEVREDLPEDVTFVLRKHAGCYLGKKKGLGRGCSWQNTEHWLQVGEGTWLLQQLEKGQ